ncbi:MAG: hypothetical protein R3B47_14635 [Bacteroidia bacterium]
MVAFQIIDQEFGEGAVVPWLAVPYFFNITRSESPAAWRFFVDQASGVVKQRTGIAGIGDQKRVMCIDAIEVIVNGGVRI